jgi:hypothetical protein
MPKKSKWGTTNDERSYPHIGEWRIRTRRFNVDDGTHFFQVKYAKNEWSFSSPQAASFNWQSAPPRKRKEFESHAAAYEWALGEVQMIDQTIAESKNAAS